MKPLVSVIILNYNGASILPVIAESIASVRKQTLSDWELILVDDGSQDGSAEFLARHADGQSTRFVQAPHRGVGAARNAGARLAQGAFLAFLDNDAIPALDWLQHLVGFFENRPDCGAAASLVFFADRPGVVNSAGSVLNELAHGMGVCMHELYPFCQVPDEIMYATGNGMAIRAEVLRQVGFFDEGFLFYGHDDSDVGIRIRNRGYTIAPVTRAKVQHLHSVSKLQPGMSFWDERNRFRFAFKHFDLVKLTWFSLFELRNLARSPERRAYTRAWFSALRRTGDLLAFRWCTRRSPSYSKRFERFFLPEWRYYLHPDNRAFARESAPLLLNQPLIVGENEERYLYQGWYWSERTPDGALRWALPTSALRFELLQEASGFALEAVLPPTLESLHLKTYLYPWSDYWYESKPLVAELALTQNTRKYRVTWSLPVPPGEYLLTFVADQYYQEDGVFPRRRSWGFRTLEAS